MCESVGVQVFGRVCEVCVCDRAGGIVCDFSEHVNCPHWFSCSCVLVCGDVLVFMLCLCSCKCVFVSVRLW